MLNRQIVMPHFPFIPYRFIQREWLGLCLLLTSVDILMLFLVSSIFVFKFYTTPLVDLLIKCVNIKGKCLFKI